MVLENYYLYRLGIWLVSHLPLRLVYFVAGLLAELNFLFNGRSRRGVYANLRRVLPPETSPRERRRIARQTFRHFACSLVDFFRIPEMSIGNLDRFVAEFRGWEHVQAAMNSGAGAVFATLHMGSWELAGAYLSWCGVPLTVVALPHCDPRINRLFLDRREGTGMEVVPVGGAMRKLGDALTRGRFIALIADRDTSGRGLRMPFFGQPARVPTGHAFLALNTGAWILPGCVYRLPDGRSAIEIRPPLIPDPNSDTVESLSLRCLGILEEFVRTRPEQWAAFYDLWSDSPKQAT